MDYGDLSAGIKYHQSKWPPGAPGEYSDLRDRGDTYWRHLENLGLDELGIQIIDGFLNSRGWNCHIPAKDPEKLLKVLGGLEGAVAFVEPLYASVETYNLEDVDFDSFVQISTDNDEAIHTIIRKIYRAFLLIEPKFGKVPASKLMHMSVPNLFPMWDNGIIDRYGLPSEKIDAASKKAGAKSNTSYLAFLILMQENIIHALQTMPTINTQQAPSATRLKSEFGGLSLPRLLDMANMAVRDCELAICTTCMRKAKKRWSKYGITPEYEDFGNEHST